MRVTGPVCVTNPWLRGALDFVTVALLNSTDRNHTITPHRGLSRPLLARSSRARRRVSSWLDEIAEHPVVCRLLFDRIHALQPGLDRGDLPGDRELADPGQDHIGVLGVRLPIDETADSTASPVNQVPGRARSAPLRAAGRPTA